MKSRVLSFVIFFILFSGTAIHAFAQQKPKLKFGKVSKEELTMAHYPLDSGASAVILGDFGEAKIAFDKRTNNFQLLFERHVRIKILDEQGYDWGNFSIPLYNSGSGSEKLRSVKAYTFNLDSQGKKEKSALDRKDIYTEKVNDRWSYDKFTLPNVKKGAVLDVRYTIESDFISQPPVWNMQYEIPVVWSDYKFSAPEYYFFKKNVQGYIPLLYAKQEQKPTTITYTYRTKLQAGTGVKAGSERVTGKFNVNINEFNWAAQNVPAFRMEPYMTTQKDYISKIQLELATVQFPNEQMEQVVNTWENINKTLVFKSDFGQQLKGNAFLNELIGELTNGMTSPSQKINAIYYWVSQNMSWNQKTGYLVTNSLRKALKLKSGSAADINMLLTAMLLKADIPAYPVILSTRNHGKLLEFRAFTDDINYVISAIPTEQGVIYLDATDPLRPAGQLPYFCLNGRGLLIDKDNSTWLDLLSNERYSETAYATLAFNEELQLEGKVNLLFKSLSALDLRHDIQNSGLEQYQQELENSLPNWNIDEVQFDKINKVGEDAGYEITLSETDLNEGADLIYLDPMILGQPIKNNPFKLENRVYPIDYGCPVEDTYIMNLQLPEGYEVAELPVSASVTLPNRSASFLYTVNQNGRNIQVMSRMNVNKTLFVPDDYQYLKDFYNQVITKQAEKIILKKSSAEASAK